MAITSFKKELWETALLEAFKGITVADLITKKPTSVEGAKAIFNTASLTTGLQNYSGTVDWEAVNTTAIELIYDQTKYFAFAVDDVDRVQLAGDVFQPIIREQAYAIKSDIDSKIFSVAAAAAPSANTIGSSSTKKSIASSNDAYEYIVDLNTALDKKDVPSTGRYIIASPDFVNLLAKDTRVIDNANVLPNGIVQGMTINGAQVIKTNLAPANQVIALYNQSVGYGKQIDKTEAMRLQGSFSDGVRGLVQYGAKALQPDGIALLHYTIATV